MHLKLRAQELKAILYTYRLIHQNPMVTTSQKSTVDIHTKKKKESKYNIKDSHQITKEKKGERRTKRINNSQNGNNLSLIHI